MSALELVEYALSRVSEKDSQLHGFITLTKEDALFKAERVDRAREAGQDLGILAGIPISYKDVFFTAGTRTTAGSNVLSSFKPQFDILQPLVA
jgi:aspartyl-tRNA(Asn)/glutamyl-tRNA(Gln) amidotransferase subunit A